MLFEIDFSVKVDGNFQSIHKAFVFADSVTDCRGTAETIRNELQHSKKHDVHIFIEA